MTPFIKRIFTGCMCACLLSSCATYNRAMEGYYADLRDHNYSKAMRSIERNKLVKKDRNALLYNLEMGKLYRLQNDFINSNLYLNRADGIMEYNRKSFGDIALANVLNPMHQAYRGEDFEKFMVHFYKALNYSALGQTEDAVVEARRITLSENIQGNKFTNKENRYSRDAFAMNLQGMIYEMAGNMNDAFIAYRNAADLYLDNRNEYYGVKIPAQLQADLLRTAAYMGFSEEQQRYRKLFGTESTKGDVPTNGELILFLEEGNAPVKTEKNFILTSGKNGIGSFYYTDADGYPVDYRFNYNDYAISEDKLSSLRTIRVALPEYRVDYLSQKTISINLNGNDYTPQLAQNLNSVAVNVLKERFLSELGSAIARQLTKKLLEKGTQYAAENIAKSKDKSPDENADAAEKEKQKKKKEEDAEHAGEVAGFLMNTLNSITEKADTRNWQSLPAFVSYVRIPLNAGENNITVNTGGKMQTLVVRGGKGLQMMGISVN